MSDRGRMARHVAALVLGLVGSVGGAPPLEVETPIPFGRAPIDYFSPAADNRVVRLAEEVAAGRRRLEFDAAFGYLPALLTALETPVESQTLVFSKTSLHRRYITPRTPRAIYFSDDVYLGWVPEAGTIEISAVDRLKGAQFYLVQQAPDQEFRLEKDGRCLTCHAATSTLQAPGHVVRSYLTDGEGNQRWGYSKITHETPFTQRWGGWYVSGAHGAMTHLGNLVGEADDERHRLNPDYGGNVTDLRKFFPVERYLAPHSDLVALLVLDHQCQAQNLLVRLGFDHRLGRGDNALEPTLRYLLFADAPRLPDPVQGTSKFAERFSARGPQDRRGRSLYELDLRDRVPKRRLSHVVYSAAFSGLPAAVREKLLTRLWEALSGDDPAYAYLPPEERQAIREIVQDTLPDLPDAWRRPARAP